MTNWDKIVSGNELQSAKRLRRRTYIAKTDRISALDELAEEGWYKVRTYKDPKKVGVRKEKPVGEVFEDKVWILFASLGFTDMNLDDGFKIQYDSKNSQITQQIDVFAANDETVIVVECKAASEQKSGSYKKDIEAFHGQMEGLRKEILKKYPKRKVKFIWATHNIVMNKADLNKLEEWNIEHFNTSTIDYYSELAKHLGTSARYQLLGHLFANQDIKNMESRIPAIQGKMGGNTYYSFSIEPEKLLKIGYVLHRNEANKNMMPTYQRLIKKSRLNAIKAFVESKGYFPNSIIINIDTGGKKALRFDLAATKFEDSISKLGTLHLPKKYRSAYIIDGQHRLYGYSDSQYASTNTIPVVAFVDLDREEQIKLFMDINENQKAVPKTLRVTLDADMLWVSSDYNEQRQALRSKIAQILGEDELSPLYGKIVIGEDTKTSTMCITIEAVQVALKRCDFFTQFDKKNVIIKDGIFDLGSNDATCSLFFPFLQECLCYIKDKLEEEWANGENENGLLTINRGIQGVIRLINDIVNHLITKGDLRPKEEKSEDIVSKVSYYIDPLITFFSAVSVEQRRELRSYFGGGADVKFWRTFQKAVADARCDFQPDGLEQYWVDEAKTFNDDSLNYMRDIESKLKNLVASSLQSKYGDEWIVHGLPRSVYEKAKKEADDYEYEMKISGYDGEALTIWDYVGMAALKQIVTYGSHWSELYDDLFTLPSDKGIRSKDKRTEWINRLNTLNNKLLKTPSYSIPKDEYEYVSSIYTWLCDAD